MQVVEVLKRVLQLQQRQQSRSSTRVSPAAQAQQRQGLCWQEASGAAHHHDLLQIVATVLSRSADRAEAKQLCVRPPPPPVTASKYRGHLARLYCLCATRDTSKTPTHLRRELPQCKPRGPCTGRGVAPPAERRRRHRRTVAAQHAAPRSRLLFCAHALPTGVDDPRGQRGPRCAVRRSARRIVRCNASSVNGHARDRRAGVGSRTRPLFVAPVGPRRSRTLGREEKGRGERARRSLCVQRREGAL